jgi:sarcosine oxidase subunit alpha
MFSAVATRLGTSNDTVELTHDGESLVARRGETLALSLIAADRLLLSRSPKLHRPRGPYCLRGACEGCLVRVDGLPNQPACRTLVAGGEVVETQNVLGSRETDLLSAADFLFPQGIDHHRLMAGVRGLSPLVGNFARRVAGLGKLADHAPPVSAAERADVSVLIVGGGRRGLTLAAQLGEQALLVDDGPELGGALLVLDPPRAGVLREAARNAGARLLSRTSVVALSREPEDGTGRLTALVVGAQGTLVVRASTVVLATGRHDAVPAFPNNDLPGIFSARAALTAWRGDVLLGSRMAVVGSGRYAEGLLQQMSGAVQLVPLDEASVVRAVGRDRISAVEVRADGKSRRIKVDALAFDGRGAPSFELAVQAGASVDFEPEAGYIPRAGADGKVAERVYVPHADPRVTVAALRDQGR